MSLQTEFTALADGFRKRFNVTDQLTIDDMIKLVTPPPFPSGINLIKKPIEFGYGDKSKSATFDAVPPQMSKPITLTLTFQAQYWLDIEDVSLVLRKNTGEILVLTIPNYSSDYDQNKTWTKALNVTIPANTSLANGNFTIYCSGNTLFTITNIIATY